MKNKKILTGKNQWWRLLAGGLVIILMIGLLTVLIDTPGDVSGTDAPETNSTETVDRVDLDPLCQHQYTKSVVEKEATCTAKGLKVSTCSKCGGTREDDIDLKAHMFTKLLPYSKDKHLLCCSICGTFGEYDDHILVESILEPTCTTSGLKILECQCGYKYEEVIQTDGHSVSSWQQKPNDQYYHYAYCPVCGETAFDAHDYGAYILVKEASCSETGLEQSECVHCGYVREKVIPYSHGDYYYEHVLNGHVEICGLCGQMSMPQAHTFGSYTYIDVDYHKAICSVCGAEDDQEHYVIYDANLNPYCPYCRSDLG